MSSTTLQIIIIISLYKSFATKPTEDCHTWSKGNSVCRYYLKCVLIASEEVKGTENQLMHLLINIVALCRRGINK